MVIETSRMMCWSLCYSKSRAQQELVPQQATCAQLASPKHEWCACNSRRHNATVAMHAACLSHWFNDRNRKPRQMVVEGCSLLAGPAKSMSSLWKERKTGVMEAVAILSCSLLPTMPKCSRTIGTHHLSQTQCCQLLVLRCLAMDSGTQSTCSATLPV